MISIYKGCVLDQWDCYNILFCFIASKTFLFYWKLISIYESLRTEKLLFQKCMNFLNYIMFGYIYICMSGKFPIFLSPPVQFMSIVLQHSMEQFVSLLLSHDLDKNQQMCKILFLLFWNASWLSFTSHSMKLQLVDISGWLNNPNYNLGFIKTQNRTSNYHFTKILHRNTL